MMRLAAPAAAAAVWALAAHALAAAPPKSADLVKAEARVDAQPGSSSGTLVVIGRISAGWHVNSHVPSEDYLIPTEVKVQRAAGVQVGNAKYPPGQSKKFSFSEKPLSVYENQFEVTIPLSWSGSLPGISGTIDFQPCNDSQCLPPASVPFSSGGGAAPAAGLSGGAVPLSAAPSATGPAAGASQDFGTLLERRGLPLVLLILFAGGLALNLTPCVYPVIPLTVSFFGGQAHGKDRRVFGLAALYVLGMATMYSALGVAAALSGKLFGSALQSPWVVGAIALVLVLLALSMFGLYDIRMPSSWMQKTGARSGAAGAYAMGLLVGVVAAPCVGPFVLGLLAFVAARQSAPLGFLFFFVLSLGLGLPYLFLAAFSGSIARLPRAGVWMEGIKKIFGWVLLAMAAYFLRPVFPAPVGPWLLPAVLIVGAAVLLAGRALRLPARAAAAVVFVAAALFFVPRSAPASGQPEWRPYAASALETAGRPAIVDFAAGWCVPCRELDEKTFSDPRVREALSRRALFKADLTQARSPDTIALSQRYEILGVPTIVFLDGDGKERRELRLVGFEDADAFLARLAKAP